MTLDLAMIFGYDTESTGNKSIKIKICASKDNQQNEKAI